MFDFDVGMFEGDGFAEDISDDDGTSSVPGPLAKALQQVWDDFMSKIEEFVQAFSKKSGKAPAVLWKWIGEVFKLTREPNFFNMWVKRFTLLNAKGADGTTHPVLRRLALIRLQSRSRSTTGATSMHSTRRRMI